MIDKIKMNEKIIKCANYYISNNSTVRETAKQFGIGKSSVHIYLTKKLKSLNYSLYLQAKTILEMLPKLNLKELINCIVDTYDFNMKLINI